MSTDVTQQIIDAFQFAAFNMMEMTRNMPAEVVTAYYNEIRETVVNGKLPKGKSSALIEEAIQELDKQEKALNIQLEALKPSQKKERDQILKKILQLKREIIARIQFYCIFGEALRFSGLTEFEKKGVADAILTELSEQDRALIMMSYLKNETLTDLSNIFYSSSEQSMSLLGSVIGGPIGHIVSAGVMFIFSQARNLFFSGVTKLKPVIKINEFFERNFVSVEDRILKAMFASALSSALVGLHAGGPIGAAIGGVAGLVLAGGYKIYEYFPEVKRKAIKLRVDREVKKQKEMLSEKDEIAIHIKLKVALTEFQSEMEGVKTLEEAKRKLDEVRKRRVALVSETHPKLKNIINMRLYLYQQEFLKQLQKDLKKKGPRKQDFFEKTIKELMQKIKKEAKDRNYRINYLLKSDTLKQAGDDFHENIETLTGKIDKEMKKILAFAADKSLYSQANISGLAGLAAFEANKKIPKDIRSALIKIANYQKSLEWYLQELGQLINEIKHQIQGLIALKQGATLEQRDKIDKKINGLQASLEAFNKFFEPGARTPKEHEPVLFKYESQSHPPAGTAHHEPPGVSPVDEPTPKTHHRGSET